MDNDFDAMSFNVLFRQEGGLWVAHCLELDIVTTRSSKDQAERDMTDLIVAAVDYAFSNDNLEHLYRPAPAEVWQEFYRCRREGETRVPVRSAYGDQAHGFVPPWIITKTCRLDSGCGV